MTILNINGLNIVSDKVAAWTFSQKLDGIYEYLQLYLVGNSSPLLIKVDATDRTRSELIQKLTKAIYGI